MPTPAQMLALKAVVPAAMASMRKWSVPASITLAQWMLESSWGASKLSLEAKNYFGIKAMHVNAPDTYEEFPTAEYENGQRVIVEALFEKFPDEQGSFDVHGQLLAQAARYKLAMLHANDPFAFAQALQNAGYSTLRPPLATNPPFYGDVLSKLIREYDLTQYDVQPPPAVAQEVAA